MKQKVLRTVEMGKQVNKLASVKNLYLNPRQL